MTMVTLVSYSGNAHPRDGAHDGARTTAAGREGDG